MAKKKTAKKKKETTGLTAVAERPEGMRGIERLVWVKREDLHSRTNPRNWRTHDRRQMEALEGTLSRNGWAGALLYNETTDNLIDGHAREKLDLTKCDLPEWVPVLTGKWTAEQEREVLLTLDPITNQAGEDSTKFAALVNDVRGHIDTVAGSIREGSVEEGIATLISSLHDDSNAITGQAFPLSAPDDTPPEIDKDVFTDTPEELPGTLTLKENPQFEHGLPYDIPPIRKDKLLEVPDDIKIWTTPDVTYTNKYFFTVLGNGNTRGLAWDKTILLTHTGDDILEKLWFDPISYTSKLINRRMLGAMSPELSVGDGWPKANRIWNVYRNRWVGRYFQEAGINLIPTVSHLVYPTDEEFLYTGIPKGCPCISMQLQAHGTAVRTQIEEQLRLYRASLQTMMRHLEPQCLILYGNLNVVQEVREYAKLPSTLRIIEVENWITARTSRRREQAAASDSL